MADQDSSSSNPPDDELPTRPDVVSYACPACANAANPSNTICEWCFGLRQVDRVKMQHWKKMHH